MKRRILLSVASLFILGFSCYSLMITPGSSSEMLFANVEALTQEEDAKWGCGGNATFVPNESLKSDICLSGGTHLKCKPNDGVCCDPSEQTDCPPISIDIDIEIL